MTATYTDKQLLRLYKSLGVQPGIVVLLASDFASLRNLTINDEPATKQQVLETHLSVLSTLLKSSGTLVVQTSSMNLCNTYHPFDPATTPSFRMGAFSEFVRQQPEALRSFHPFVSYAAIGPQAYELLTDIPRHPYASNSVIDRLCKVEALSLSVGQHPRFNCTVVHYAERLSGVPYRYTKEFCHPVIRNGKVCVEPWYLDVLYQTCDVERDRNLRFFSRFGNRLKEKGLGSDHIPFYSYYVKDLLNTMLEEMNQDIYSWLRTPPTNRPYRR